MAAGGGWAGRAWRDGARHASCGAAVHVCTHQRSCVLPMHKTRATGAGPAGQLWRCLCLETRMLAAALGAVPAPPPSRTVPPAPRPPGCCAGTHSRRNKGQPPRPAAPSRPNPPLPRTLAHVRSKIVLRWHTQCARGRQERSVTAEPMPLASSVAMMVRQPSSPAMASSWPWAGTCACACVFAQAGVPGGGTECIGWEDGEGGGGGQGDAQRAGRSACGRAAGRNVRVVRGRAGRGAGWKHIPAAAACSAALHEKHWESTEPMRCVVVALWLWARHTCNMHMPAACKLQGPGKLCPCPPPFCPNPSSSPGCT